MHRYKTKLKYIKTKERIFWRKKKKTTGSMMINTFLKISSKLEGILHHLCTFYPSCSECRSFYNLMDSLKVFRDDFCFDSVGMLFLTFGPR